MFKVTPITKPNANPKKGRHSNICKQKESARTKDSRDIVTISDEGRALLAKDQKKEV